MLVSYNDSAYLVNKAFTMSGVPCLQLTPVCSNPSFPFIGKFIVEGVTKDIYQYKFPKSFKYLLVLTGNHGIGECLLSHLETTPVKIHQQKIK